MYRHDLRASEAKHIKWTDFDLASGSGPKTFHVRRLKGSIDSVHTLDRDEVSALRKLKATSTSPFVFVSGRGAVTRYDRPHRRMGRATWTKNHPPRHFLNSGRRLKLRYPLLANLTTQREGNETEQRWSHHADFRCAA